MANINLKRFVNIDIKQHVSSSVLSTRDTVVLYSAEGNAGTIRTVSSLTEATELYSNMPTILAYLTVFFNNAGIKVKVIEGTNYANLTSEMLTKLGNEYICIAYASTIETKANVYAKLKSIAKDREVDADIYGINEKLIIAATSETNDQELVKNFAVKYSTVVGSEMTIAAYLSKINVYNADSIYDYAFTAENIAEEVITDSMYALLMSNNMNVDVYLANKVRNCGGNCKDGLDLVNSYVKIILHQTLTDRLLDLLAEKLKGSVGISKIYTVICQELEKYLVSGYLTNDKIWTDNTLSIAVNDATYQIIEQGTALTNGYIVKVLPLSSLSEEDKKERKAPLIYVILADQYGIRQITVNGEVI